MPAKNHAGTRYGPLDEIDSANASRLRVSLTVSTGVAAGREAAPLVVGSARGWRIRPPGEAWKHGGVTVATDYTRM